MMVMTKDNGFSEALVNDTGFYSPTKKPLTPERIAQILAREARNRAELQRYIAGCFQLSPRSRGLRLL